MAKRTYPSTIGSRLLFLVVILAVTYLTTLLVAPAHAYLKARMYKGEEVKVLLGCQISTDTVKAGSQFLAKVNEDFKKGDDIFIYKGDPVFATVAKVKKPGWYGKGSELVIRFDSTMSSGGTFVPLKGELKCKGKGRKTIAYALFFIGWAIKGKNAETTPADTTTTQVNVPDYIEIEFKP
jgi:hypothetical protein